MSETFALDWLSLREPADSRARAFHPIQVLRTWCATRNPLRVVDFGAGSGSLLRDLAPRLGGEQHWCLLDHDAQLLASAVSGFAASDDGDHAWREEGFTAQVRTRVCDFSLPSSIPAIAADLVTASALLDLVSRPWMAAFAERARAAGAAVYCSLNYAGSMAIDPEDADDGRVIEAFNDHQRTNKGMGPALGPEAVPDLQARLLALGYSVTVARSDWVLRREDAELAARLIDGIASAASESGVDSAGWKARRLDLLGRRRSVVRVAHFDLLGLPEPT